MKCILEVDWNLSQSMLCRYIVFLEPEFVWFSRKFSETLEYILVGCLNHLLCEGVCSSDYLDEYVEHLLGEL